MDTISAFVKRRAIFLSVRKTVNIQVTGANQNVLSTDLVNTNLIFIIY